MPTLGIMADPGLPEHVSRSIQHTLVDGLYAQAGQRDSREAWKVEVARETLPLDADGNIPLLDRSKQIREQRGWDYLAYLTDLPLAHDEEILLCEVNEAEAAALISLPALGIWRLRARTSRLILTLVSSMSRTASLPSAVQLGGRRAEYRRTSEGESERTFIMLPGRWNVFRLVFGMIRSNRPGRLLPALSSTVVAAIATGAFGIFYASMWNMADALSPLRLTIISVLAIATLSAWLIMRNGLWNPDRHRETRYRARRDNISTVVTIGISVTLAYLVLQAVLLAGSLIVIASGYLETQLDHDITMLDYVQLSWLAASLGTIAGALGSNFDSEEAVREATYSRRQHERRQLAFQEERKDEAAGM